MSDYVPVPVEAARAIAERYAKSIVIICAHDPVHGALHTTTYGVDPQNKAWAAQGGELATKALGGLTELADYSEDYRLNQARQLLKALQSASKILRALGDGKGIKGYRADIDAIHEAVRAAEEFL